MDGFEVFVLLISITVTVLFFIKWYGPVFRIWTPKRGKSAKIILGFLPLAVFLMVLTTLLILASGDVINDYFFIFFYIMIGFAWLYACLLLFYFFFDFSVREDVISLSNTSALFAIIGSVLGITLVYCGANIGDGPGWWCVFFAGGLGMILWFVLILISNKTARIFERVTVEKDTACGIRFCFYLIAAGLVLARASGGDWTSFYMTVIEFLDGWPVLPLTGLFILTERYFISKAKNTDEDKNYIMISVMWGAVLLLLSILSVATLPPLKIHTLF